MASQRFLLTEVLPLSKDFRYYIQNISYAITLNRLRLIIRDIIQCINAGHLYIVAKKIC